jgi:hypothetical protein
MKNCWIISIIGMILGLAWVGFLGWAIYKLVIWVISK